MRHRSNALPLCHRGYTAKCFKWSLVYYMITENILHRMFSFILEMKKLCCTCKTLIIINAAIHLAAATDVEVRAAKRRRRCCRQPGWQAAEGIPARAGYVRRGMSRLQQPSVKWSYRQPSWQRSGKPVVGLTVCHGLVIPDSRDMILKNALCSNHLIQVNLDVNSGRKQNVVQRIRRQCCQWFWHTGSWRLFYVLRSLLQNSNRRQNKLSQYSHIFLQLQRLMILACTVSLLHKWHYYR